MTLPLISDIQYRIQFLGSSNPIIGTKIRNTSKKSIYRNHCDFLDQNANWLHYQYFLKGVERALDHKEVEVSLFLTQFAALVGCRDGFLVFREIEE